jgi:hypothetical protein
VSWRKGDKNKSKYKLPFDLTGGLSCKFSAAEWCMVMTFRTDFRQLRNCIRDDAFAESVLGSQGNMEDHGTFCLGEAFCWMKGPNG